MDEVQILLFGIVGIIILGILIKLLKLPIKLLINGIFGVILLYIVNFIGASYGFMIGINIWTALIAGIFGIPGVALLVIAQLFL